MNKGRLFPRKRSIVVPCMTLQQVQERARSNNTTKTVILAVGTNNTNTHPTEFQAEIGKTIQHLKRSFPVAEIHICTIAPRTDRPGSHIQTLNDIIKKTARTNQIQIIDVYTDLVQHPAEAILKDNVHPNHKGLGIMASTIKRGLGYSPPHLQSNNHYHIPIRNKRTYAQVASGTTAPNQVEQWSGPQPNGVGHHPSSYMSEQNSTRPHAPTIQQNLPDVRTPENADQRTSHGPHSTHQGPLWNPSPAPPNCNGNWFLPTPFGPWPPMNWSPQLYSNPWREYQ